MGVIRKLPDSLSRRIAAGEVIERPLSVVKELIENSLDAGAKSVAVDLVQGGKVLISVKDDGCGMSPEDLPLAVEKHATSKIFNEEDLDRIVTLGYRGEALASVCAVSGLEIYSRRKELEEGSVLKCENGVVSVSPINLLPGTTIVVKDLFYNLPARRKFMKSALSEYRRILSLVRDYAFAYPEVSFSLSNDGKRTLRTSGSGEINKLLEALWGSEPCIVSSQTEDAASLAKAWWQDLGPKSRLNLTIFVNGRRINNAVIRSALLSFNWAPRGNWLIMLDLAPEDIDVNVHPAKSEILLRHSGDVYSLVRKTVEKLSKDFSPLPARERSAFRPVSNDELSENKSQFSQDRDSVLPEAAVRDFKIEKEKPSSEKPYIPEREAHPFSRVTDPFARRQVPPSYTPSTRKIDFPKPEVEDKGGETVPEDTGFELLGRASQGYLVFSCLDGLMIVDPHAAHERVNYERVLKSCRSPQGSEKLLVPVQLPPTLREDALLATEKLEELGFDLSEGGELEAMPLHPKAVDLTPIELLRSALSAITDGGESGTLLDRFATKACKASVKLSDKLSDEECVKLLSDLLACDEPNACPHGRPTVLKLTGRMLDKYFGRLGL